MFYKYNVTTGKYEGEVKDAYYTLDGKLVKGYTNIAPPTIPSGQELFFNGKWVLKAIPKDYRGSWIDINGNVQNINQLGVVPKTGYAKENNGIWYYADGKEATDITLMKQKEQKTNKLKADFASLRSNGTMLSATINKQIDANYESLNNIASLIDYMTANSVANIQYRCADNSFVKVTVAELKAMKEELIGFGLQMYQKKWTIEGKIKAATTLTDLSGINWDANLNLI